MRTVIFAVVLLVTTNVVSQNKFIFSSGIEFNEWNKDMINGSLIYMNTPNDDNYAIYIEAVRTVESMGGDFNNPDVDESKNDGTETSSDVIYERKASESNSYLRRIYYLDGKTVTVHIGSISSVIRIDKTK
jgi:hypothetical protein